MYEKTERARNSDDDVKRAVAEARNMRHALVLLGLDPRGANYPRLRARIDALGLSTTHWSSRPAFCGTDPAPPGEPRPLAEILVEGSDYQNRTALKRRLMASGMMPKSCSECGLSEWRGRPITLQIDHINGHAMDHRIENLRVLCPNCHAQTETYRGRNKANAA